MALGGSVALAAVGPLVIDRAMPAVVVGGDKIVFQEEINLMPTYQRQSSKQLRLNM